MCPPKPTSNTPKRKKTFFQKWKQLSRIRRRAKEGPPLRAILKEFLPLVREWIDEESIAATTRQDFGETVRIRAKEGAVDAQKKIRGKIHAIALSRALTLAKVFSREERKTIRIKMDFIFYQANPRQINTVLVALKKKLGARFQPFYRMYMKTVNATNEYVNQMYYLVKNKKM